MGAWRRISDWKHEVVLVALADVERALVIDEVGWARPADRAGRWPKLAALARESGIARVEAEVAKQLRARGVTTHWVGYHRVSDGWGYERTGREPRKLEGEAPELVSRLIGEGEEDDARYDALRHDVLDAILRASSDGVLTERAVILAAALPPLGPASDEPDLDEDELDEMEAGEPPRAVEDELVDRVRAAITAGPAPKQPDPVARKNAPRLLQSGLALGLLAYFVHRRGFDAVAMIVGVAAIVCLVIGLLALVQKK